MVFVSPCHRSLQRLPQFVAYVSAPVFLPPPSRVGPCLRGAKSAYVYVGSAFGGTQVRLEGCLLTFFLLPFPHVPTIAAALLLPVSSPDDIGNLCSCVYCWRLGNTEEEYFGGAANTTVAITWTAKRINKGGEDERTTGYSLRYHDSVGKGRTLWRRGWLLWTCRSISRR